MDPDYWESPEVFNPERFMTSEIRDHFVPFGIGKRACMGEILAKTELFLFTVLMVQNIKLAVSEKHGAPDPQEFNTGITNVPVPFHVSITVR
jgi:cytochrome P450